MAGTLNVNQLIPDPGQNLYINTGEYGANLIVGNATTQLLVVSPDGGFKVPVGTTTNRPLNPQIGFIRFNTDTGSLENYTANGWFKVSSTQSLLSSISGLIYSGNTSTLTLSGSGFTSAAIVNYASGSTTANVSVTPSPGGSSISIATPSAIYNLNAGNTVSISVTNSDGITSGSLSSTIIGLPTGGNTITTISNTRIHTFNSSGTLTVPTGFSATASYLVVGGGGGAGGGINGGYGSGGGGAGGMITGTTSISVGTYTVTVGSGGSGTTGNITASPGQNSVFSTYTASGGGYGSAMVSPAGGPGGSGGGSSAMGTGVGVGGSGTPGQGNPGGTAGPAAGYSSSGGGGGAGAAGTAGVSSPVTPTSGVPGGNGLSSSISGAPVFYAGGGAGGGTYGSGPAPGGSGGGGAAGATAGSPGSNGTTNLGGGGGGCTTVGTGTTFTGGSGGSGVVIVSYTI